MLNTAIKVAIAEYLDLIYVCLSNFKWWQINIFYSTRAS